MTADQIREIADDYRQQLVDCYVVAKLVRALPVAEVLDRMAFAQTWGPLADPTLYIEKSQAMTEDKAVVRILARAQRELDALPWPETP